MGFLIGSEQSWQLPWWMSVCVTRVSQWSGSRKICNCGQEDFMSLRMEGTDCRSRLVAQDNNSIQDLLGLFFLLTAQVAFPLVCVAYSFCFMVNTLSIHTVLRWHSWSPWQWQPSPANQVSLLGALSKHSDVQPCELPPPPQGWLGGLQSAGDPSCLLFIRSCRGWQSGNGSQQIWFLSLWANYLGGPAWVSFGTSLTIKLRITILTTQWGYEFSH